MQLDGYVQGGTRRTIAGPKLMRNAGPVFTGPQSGRGISCSQAYKIINHLCCLQFDDYLRFNSFLTRCHRLTLCCIIIIQDPGLILIGIPFF